MLIFAGVPLGGGVKWEWGWWRRQFLAIWVATSSESSIRDKASSIIWRYAAPCRPVTDCKMNDLEWLFHVKIRFRPALLDSEHLTFKNNCISGARGRRGTITAINLLRITISLTSGQQFPIVTSTPVTICLYVVREGGAAHYWVVSIPSACCGGWWEIEWCRAEDEDERSTTVSDALLQCRIPNYVMLSELSFDCFGQPLKTFRFCKYQGAGWREDGVELFCGESTVANMGTSSLVGPLAWCLV